MTLETYRQLYKYFSSLISDLCWPLLCKSNPTPVRISYIKLVKANEIIFLDLSDVIVLEVNDHCVFRDLLGDRDLTCLVKETHDYRVWG